MISLRVVRILGLAALSATASGALAQSEIVSLGDGAVIATVNDGGTTLFGAAGTGAARWTVGGGSVALLALDGSRVALGASADGAYAVGAILNTAGAGGLPADAEIAGRWNAVSGWVSLGVMTPNPALEVSGSGSSFGYISDPRGISATGRFVVGQGYIQPDDSFRFRPWLWDAQAQGGAGEMIVLPTSYHADLGRYRNGRALSVSSDGLVVVGGEEPNSSEGRMLVWRFNSSAGAYEYSYLANGIDPNTSQEYTSSVDELLINPAGTIIVGSSYEYDAQLGWPQRWLTKWVWNAGTQTWDRVLLATALESLPTWWVPVPGCDIPPDLSVTDMTDDGGVIVGRVVYSTCGSFERAAFIWTAASNSAVDLYEYLQGLGVTNIGEFAPPLTGGPPRLGSDISISGNGQYLAGWGSPVFSNPGPGWLANLAAPIQCIPPFVTAEPSPVDFSRCDPFIMSAGGGGSLPIVYQWLKNGQPLADGSTGSGSIVVGATTNRLRIESPTPSDAGSYSCRITGACGAPVTTATAIAQVSPASVTPPNDTCATASNVSEGLNLFAWSPCAAWVDDPQGASCVAESSADVWFRYTPTFTGDVRIETCSAFFDTVISVYDGCGGSEIACNDTADAGPSCGWSGARIARLPVTLNQPVWIRVGAIGFIFSGWEGNISIFPAPDAAVNDTCVTAVAAQAGENPFDTSEATNDSMAGCSFAVTRDVWFTYTPGADEWLTARTCPGTTWNTVLSIYDACSGNELACNDDAGVEECWTQSIIGLSVQQGVTYWIRVGGGWETDYGPGVLTLTLTGVGDLNCDGRVNNFDIDPFVLALSDPAGYAAAYSYCTIDNADCNGDGLVNNFDIDAFVALITGG